MREHIRDAAIIVDCVTRAIALISMYSDDAIALAAKDISNQLSPQLSVAENDVLKAFITLINETVSARP